MENNTLCHRQYIDAALLKPSKYVSTDIDNEFYEMLRENIRHNKVLKPVIATRGLVISGCYTIKYADGKTRDCFQIGLSANKTGISVYIMGIKDKTYLPQTYGKTLGKASVTGYCIKFKKLKDINMDVLEDLVRYGAMAQGEKSEEIKK